MNTVRNGWFWLSFNVAAGYVQASPGRPNERFRATPTHTR